MSEIITLPATGETAVAGYSATIISSWEAREGTGFRASLKRGNKIVGEISQKGDGGMTDVYFNNAEEKSIFKAYVAEWTFTWGAEFGEAFPHDEESVANALAYEALELRIMNRSKKLYIRKISDGKTYEVRFPIAKGEVALPSAIANQLVAGDKFWNKEQWVTV